jgi:hypothetical protein
VPIRKRTTATERDGVNFVRTVVERHNCIFHEIHRENDYGNDAFIELVDGELVTGICLVLQIKSGQSYCTASTCAIPCTDEQKEYWAHHKLTVVGIVYDPTEETAYWTNITNHLRDRARWKSRITFEKTEISRFDDDSFSQFFLAFFLKRAIRLDRDYSVRFAFSDNFAMHSIGVKSLFFGYRNDLHTWDYFHQLLLKRDPKEITGFLAYAYAHIPGHGDIVWTKDTILEEEIRSTLKQQIASFGPEEILQMLRMIDENWFCRGSVGQSVFAIVDLVVSEPGKKLESIILNDNVEVEARELGLVLYCLVMQERAEPLLSELSASESTLEWRATDLLKHLKQEGFFYAD